MGESHSINCKQLRVTNRTIETYQRCLSRQTTYSSDKVLTLFSIPKKKVKIVIEGITERRVYILQKSTWIDACEPSSFNLHPTVQIRDNKAGSRTFT